MGLEIARMLCLSTAHLRVDTRRRMQEAEGGGRGDDMPIVYGKNIERASYGWFVPLIEEKDVPLPERCPEDLVAAIAFARAAGAQWIMFDVDGPLEDGLAVHE